MVKIVEEPIKPRKEIHERRKREQISERDEILKAELSTTT